jgi:hypothetical protein
VTVAQAPPVRAAPAPAIRPAIPAAPPPAAAAAAKILAPTPAPKVAAPKAEAPAPKPPAPVAKAETPKPEAAKPAAGGGAVVQIGAVSSKALADQAWKDAVAVSPGLAAGKGKGVEPIEKNGGTLYRTSVTGFASKADAQAFCAKLQAAGKSCFVR